ncbi:hypothetical protein V501_03343 [Pseudogymnoascus sp. VKM F-4519 (FW-2642)]|nr:hypothetical protein V501_03343 [Pseudogymnoascus sp. VKM F-4519 (FW-2642)]
MCQKSPPGSTLDFNQDQERSATSDSDQEELIPDYTIDLSDAAVSLDNSDAIRRERKLLYGEVQDETAESVGQTATTMEINLQLISEQKASHVQTQGKLLPRQTIHPTLTPAENLNELKRENSALHATTQQLCRNLDYTTGQMDQLRAGNSQLWKHNTEINDKWRASELEISELRKKNEALKTELYVYKGVTRSHHSEALSNDGNGGKRSGGVARSELQYLSETSPAKKRSKSE